LQAVVAAFLVGAVVVPGRGVEREVVDQVSIRLEEGQPPVLVEGAAVVGRAGGSMVDRVAEADDEPDVVGVGQPLHRARHFKLPVPVHSGGDAHAEVAQRQERDGIDVIRGRVGAQALVGCPPRGYQIVRRPVEALSLPPWLVVDPYPVPIRGGRAQPVHPDVVGLTGDGARRDRSVIVEYLHLGAAERDRPRTQGFPGPLGPPRPAVLTEPEPTPRDQGRLGGHVDKLDIRLKSGIHDLEVPATPVG
jgi:hypothetical protein